MTLNPKAIRCSDGIVLPVFYQVIHSQIKIDQIMKKYFFAICWFVLSTQVTKAQIFHAPSNPEYPINATIVSGVLNTGADMVIDQIGYSKVMVYDGNEPKFAWETNLSTGRSVFYHNTQHHSGYIPVDPDVILNNSRDFALVCYELDGEIWLSVWELIQGGYVEIVGAFGNFNVPMILGYGSNPNIDIGYQDEFVVTWQSVPYQNQTSIEALAGDILSGVLSLAPNVAAIFTYNSLTPDVTVCEDNVTFTFIRKYAQGADDWVTFETTYTDVYNATGTGTLHTIPIQNQIPTGVFGRPRIASPPPYTPYPGFPGYDASDYTTTVDYYWEDLGIGLWQINVYQKNNAQYYNGTAHIYNDYNYLVPNTEPVVSYLGDLGVVCWTATIEYPNTSYTSLDVVARYFQTTGGNYGYPFGGLDVPVVNDNYIGTQHIPSVAGRRWNTGFGFYFWRDVDQGDMYHRTGQQGSLNLRKGMDDPITASTLQESLNLEQFGENLRVTSSLDNYSIQIMDISGRMMMKANGSGDMIFGVENLPRGVYIIRGSAGNISKSLKFVRY
jgi:hypothetical protein